MTQNENVIIIAPPSEQHLRSRWDFWPSHQVEISVVSDDQTVLGQKKNKKKPLMYLDPLKKRRDFRRPSHITAM